jgi:integrase
MNQPLHKGIRNRSPWQVNVRNRPPLSRVFPRNDKRKADAYLIELQQRGLSGTLVQLETSFELRVRRAGNKDQQLTFDTYELALQAKLKMESDLSISIVRDYSAAVRNTLQDLMTRYIQEVAPTHKGGDIEIQRLKRMGRDEAFVDKPLAALTTEDLQDFISARLEEVAPSTVDRDIDVLSQVLSYAADVWKISPAESPLKGLRRPKYFNERDRRLRGDEERLLQNALAECRNPFIDAIFVVAIDTAMRRSEIIGLRWDCIDFEQRSALLTDTKNGRSRKVPLSQRVLTLLRALQLEAADERVFPVSANALKLAFRRAVERAGIEDFHFHDLRHEAISRLAESGKFQLIDLQAISGHRDMRMLLRYTHLCTKMLAEKMDTVAHEALETYLHRGRTRVRPSIKKSSTHAVPAKGNDIDFPTRSAAKLRRELS